MTESEVKNVPQENFSTSPIEPGEDGIDPLDYLLVLLKYKKTILGISSFCTALAVLVVIFLHNIYVSTARILPPPGDKTGLSAVLSGSSVGDLAALAGVSIGSSTGDLYIGMLQSRTIADAVIDRFQLMQVYEENYRLKTYEKLAKNVRFTLGKDDGIISIVVQDEKPQRAAEMANAYVEELKKINIRLNLNSAGRERVFLEDRLTTVKQDLIQAEDQLKTFQEQNKAIRIDDQATAIISAIAALKGQLASKEIELGVLLSFQTEQNPEVKAAKEAIAQLKAQLKNLEQSPEGQKISEDIFITTSDVPGLGLQYARLMRNFKVQETLFEILTKQYEIAKLSEARNTSTIQVLDEAVPADKKSKPKRGMIIVIVTLLGLIFSIIICFIQNYIDSMTAIERHKWFEIKDMVKIYPFKR